MEYKQYYGNYWKRNFWIPSRSKIKYFDNYTKARILKKWVSSGSLVDVGGGGGDWAWYFKDNFKKVIVTDISNHALKKVTEKDIQTIQCSVFKIPLSSKSVDCIFFLDVFEHIEPKDLDKALKELRRILKDDGSLIIETTCNGYGLDLIFTKVFHGKMWKRTHKKFGEFEGHFARKTFKEMKKLFINNGLKVTDYRHNSLLFQPTIIFIKEQIFEFIQFIKNKNAEKKYLRPGQEAKEFLRRKQKLSWIASFLSWVCYLDVLLFGKIISGSSIYLKLEKHI